MVGNHPKILWNMRSLGRSSISMGKWKRKAFPDKDSMCILGVLAVRVHQAEASFATPGRKQRASFGMELEGVDG